MYLSDGQFLRFLRGEEEVGGINLVTVKGGKAHARDGIHFFNCVNLVVPEGDANQVVGIGQKDIHRVALEAEVACLGGYVVAHVEAIHEAAQQNCLCKALAHVEFNDILVESRGIAHTIDARNGGNDDDIVAPREEGRGGGEAQFVNLFVDSQVLFDVRIGGGNVGFGLIVVVVGNVVFHGIVGEECLELLVELCRQRLVVTKHQGGTTHLGNDVGNGERFARTGHAEQGLAFLPSAKSFHQLADGFGLVACGGIVGNKLEGLHLAVCALVYRTG